MNRMLLIVSRAYAHGLFIQGRRLSNQAKKFKGVKRQEIRVEQDNLARKTRIAMLASAFLRKIPYSKLEKKTIDHKFLLANKVAFFLESLTNQISGYKAFQYSKLSSDILAWMNYDNGAS